MSINFVLLTLDCVRPDHLGCYGYSGVETPNLDRMAASAVVFEEAFTHAPNTWVSHATVFTGCLPPVHGIRAPGHLLSRDVTTVAEWFAAHGWATAAFPGTSLVGKAQGFQRGFQLFDVDWEKEGLCTDSAFWRRNWSNTWEKILSWMNETQEPFLLWIHYMDTHHLPHLELPDYFRTRFSPRWHYYDGKISYADQVCVGPLVSCLEQRDILDRTALVVFADHGEELREDDCPRHDMGLGEDVMRVPLILSPPRRVHTWRSQRVRGLVGLVDLFPTLCEMAGLSVPDGIQGRSLWGVARRDPRGIGGPIYMENWAKGLFGLRTKEWKLVVEHRDPLNWDNVKPSSRRLFHIASDPAEQNDLSTIHPKVVDELYMECGRLGRGRVPEHVDASQARDIRRALKGLGYL